MATRTAVAAINTARLVPVRFRSRHGVMDPLLAHHRDAIERHRKDPVRRPSRRFGAQPFVDALVEGGTTVHASTSARVERRSSASRAVLRAAIAW